MEEEKIEKLARTLEKKLAKETAETEGYIKTKHLLVMIGAGAFLAMVAVAPPTAMLAKFLIKRKRDEEWREWKQYNWSYLHKNIERLRKQKLVEIYQEGGREVVKITKNGRRRILKYALEEIQIEKPRKWDGKWRLIIYDVAVGKKYLQQIFRDALKGMGFLGLQKSVWLYPYDCYQVVEFLREYHDLGNDVIYAILDELEDDKPYRDYFGV